MESRVVSQGERRTRRPIRNVLLVPWYLISEAVLSQLVWFPGEQELDVGRRGKATIYTRLKRFLVMDFPTRLEAFRPSPSIKVSIPHVSLRYGVIFERISKQSVAKRLYSRDTVIDAKGRNPTTFLLIC